MRAIIILVFGLTWAAVVQAQIGSSISADGSAPNDNAMLDVKSPTTGAGKGILIPRITQAQRTMADGNQAGGLLDSSGNLRGGAAQGLIVYQTDGVQGLYFNTSLTAAPTWTYLGEETDPRWASASNAIVANIATRLTSNIWAAADSTTNYLPRTGGTMSGALNMGAQIVSNVASIDFNGTDVSVGREANGSASGAAIGYQANGFSNGAVVGVGALGLNNGAVVGWNANGSDYGVALGRTANGANYGAAAGYLANGADNGVAVGRTANGNDYGVALGREANGSSYGAAIGWSANSASSGAAVGRDANGFYLGTAVGRSATGRWYGVAMGYQANGTTNGVAIGYAANGVTNGVAIGYQAQGRTNGVAIGYGAYGPDSGVAIGYGADGSQSNIAIGWNAGVAQPGAIQRIAIGNGVSNNSNNTVRIRGALFLDGGDSNIYYRTTFGSGGWTVKTFEIDHPLDPQNKILRHYCLEGPQVWNVYAGNAQLQNGQAVVQLPDYYAALNLVGSEICSLTPWGRANVWVAQGVDSNTFSIAGDVDVKVSWTIKVLRNDPGCLEDLKRRPVEQMKSELEIGK